MHASGLIRRGPIRTAPLSVENMERAKVRLAAVGPSAVIPALPAAVIREGRHPLASRAGLNAGAIS
jgi:hypothetical protein